MVVRGASFRTLADFPGMHCSRTTFVAAYPRQLLGPGRPSPEWRNEWECAAGGLPHVGQLYR